MSGSETPMRILLSAYACEPNKGSEPGVGWNWAHALVKRGHEVWVLTRENNRAVIEAELQSNASLNNPRLHFIYYDVPKWASWWKKGGRGVHLYYFLWQCGVYSLAKKWHEKVGFQLIHHVTFVGVRQPSFLGRLGTPFIFGPVAGGESVPWPLRKAFGWRGWVTDLLRDVANQLVRFDPFMHMTFASAQSIYVTSEQTKRLIPLRYKKKVAVQLAIALERDKEIVSVTENMRKFAGYVSPVRFLYVGNFLDLKGMQLGLPAFLKASYSVNEISLTLLGKGNGEHHLRNIATNLGITEKIKWMPWRPQSELSAVYAMHDVLFFPSLRDSGGMVVLEAMAHGLPVVCLKLGGPGVMVDETCGRAIDVAGADVDTTVARLADALIELASSPTLRHALGEGARKRAEASTWDAAVERIYVPLEQELAGSTSKMP